MAPETLRCLLAGQDLQDFLYAAGLRQTFDNVFIIQRVG